MSAEQRLRDLNIVLPLVSAPAANYANAVHSGNLLFISGKGPLAENGTFPKGKLGREFTCANFSKPKNMLCSSHVMARMAKCLVLSLCVKVMPYMPREHS